jgi:hypothetical protein
VGFQGVAVGPNPNQPSVEVETSSSGDTTLVAAKPGIKFVVTGYNFVASDTVGVRLYVGSTPVTGRLDCVANTGISASGIFANQGAVNADLKVNLDAAKHVGGLVNYLEIPA